MAIIGINGKIGSGKDTIGSIIQYLVDKDRAGYQHPDSQEDFISYCKNFNPKYCKWKVKKFAGKLKEIAALLTGCTIEQLEDQEFKKQPLGFDWSSGHCVGASSTYRELLQLLGTEIMRDRVHPNVWVNALMADYTGKIAEDHQFIDDGKTHPLLLEYPKWIITDMRFPNELEAVKAKGGITIRVERAFKPIKKGGLAKPYGDLFIITKDCWVDGDYEIPTKLLNTVVENESFDWLEAPAISNHPSETALDNHAFDYVIENDGTIDDLIQKVKVILVKEDIIK